MSTSTTRSVMRRLRFLPLQLVILVAVVLGLVTLNTFRYVNESNGTWSKVRQDELKKYNTSEVDLEYIRSAGYVDYKIQSLSDQDINTMNASQLMVAVHSFLDNTDVLCKWRIRMGLIGDGGWEVCDDEGARLVPSCLVYSFGYWDNTAFEEDISRVYECEVHYFNPYYEGDEDNRTGKVFIHSYGVGRYTEMTANGQELYTFSDIKAILGHTRKNIDLVKIDIEGNEWPVLTGLFEASALDTVKQILVKCHLGFPPNNDRMRRAVRVLKSLSQANFKKFYVHKNPRGSYHHPHFPVLRAKSYDIHCINSRFLKKQPKKLNA